MPPLTVLHVVAARDMATEPAADTQPPPIRPNPFLPLLSHRRETAEAVGAALVEPLV